MPLILKIKIDRALSQLAHAAALRSTCEVVAQLHEQ